MGFQTIYRVVAPSTGWIGAGMVVIQAGRVRGRRRLCGGFVCNLEDHDLSFDSWAPREGFVQIQQPVTMAWRLHGGGVTNDLSN